MIERAREYYSGFGFQGIIGIVDIYPVGDQRMMIAADLGQNILWAEVLPGPGHGLTEQGAFLQSRLYKQVLSTEAQEKAERMQETNPQEHAPLIPTFRQVFHCDCLPGQQTSFGSYQRNSFS